MRLNRAIGTMDHVIRKTILYVYVTMDRMLKACGNTISHTQTRSALGKGTTPAASHGLNKALHDHARERTHSTASLQSITSLNTPLRSCQGALMVGQPGHHLDHKFWTGVGCNILAVGAV